MFLANRVRHFFCKEVAKELKRFIFVKNIYVRRVKRGSLD
jgi:hypothetical protein